MGNSQSASNRERNVPSATSCGSSEVNKTIDNVVVANSDNYCANSTSSNSPVPTSSSSIAAGTAAALGSFNAAGGNRSSFRGGGSNIITQSSSSPEATACVVEVTMAGSQPLSTFQKRMLLQTWSHVGKTSAGGIGNVAYQRLLQRKPEMRDMFMRANAVQSFNVGSAGGALQNHIKLLTELLEQAVTNLDKLDIIGDQCAEYGAQHSQLHQQGFTAELWDVFGEVLLESITQLDTVRKHRELVKGWTVLISFLVDRFRQGYQAGVRKMTWNRGGGGPTLDDAAAPAHDPEDGSDLHEEPAQD